MFWVLKKSVSLRQFWWVPTTYVSIEKKENYFSLTHPYLKSWYWVLFVSWKCYLLQKLDTLTFRWAYWVNQNAGRRQIFFFNPLPTGKIFMLFCCQLIFFSKSTFSKNSFRNTIRVSNSLDPDQVRRFVWPDLGPNCMQKLSADNKRR